MITQEHEFYLRFILLLIQGGTEVLREIAAKALQKCNTHLNNFLSKNASAIQNTRDLSKKQKEILYPSSPTVVSSIKNYDITLLSYLITNFLTENLDGNEKNAVDKIKEMRNVYHAHTNEAKMTASIYTKEWNKLVRIIYTVSHNLPEEKRNSLNEIIDSIENEQLDIKVVIDEIRKLDQTNDFFEYIKKSIDDLNQNLDARFSRIEKDILEIKFRLENQGKKTKVVNTVRGQVTLSADEQETVDYAEKLLLEASKEIVEKSQKEHNKQLKQKVGDFLQDVEQLDIKVEKVSKGSIVFEFKCFSLSALLDLINFFNSSKFKARLHEIAAALEDITGKKINISGTLDIQSFHDVITKMQEKKYEKVVNFEMECTGVDGLLHAVEIFEGEKAANSLNELSTALSESVGKPVTLNTSIDIDQMQRAIDSIKEELDYPESDETSMNPSERDVGRQTECDTVMAMADTVANTVYDVSPHSKSVASLNLSSELKLKSYLTHKQDITTELNGKGTDRRIFPAVTAHGSSLSKMGGKYYRLVCLVVNVCAELLRKYFLKLAQSDTATTYTDLKTYLTARHPEIKMLVIKKIIRGDQYGLLFPSTKNTNESEWDVTLIITLLQHLFKIESNAKVILNTIRDERNMLQHRSNTKEMTDIEFDQCWSRLEIAAKDLAKLVSDTSGTYEKEIAVIISEEKVNNLPGLGDALKTFYEEVIKQMAYDMQILKESILKLESTTDSAARNSKEASNVLLKVTATKGRSGKRVKTFDNVLSGLKQSFRRTMSRLGKDYKPGACVDVIKTELRDKHHVVVTGNCNSRYLDTALYVIRDLDYDMERCVEMNSASDWRHIQPDDVDLVLCRNPFGNYVYDDNKACRMIDIFDDILGAVEATDGENNIDFVIVTNEDCLPKDRKVMAHKLMKEGIKLTDTTTDAQLCNLSGGVVTQHPSNHCCKRGDFLKCMTSTILDNYSKHIATIDHAKLEDARELLRRHRMVAISGPAKSGKTSTAVA